MQAVALAQAFTLILKLSVPSAFYGASVITALTAQNTQTVGGIHGVPHHLCEMESAEPLIGTLGEESIAFWKHYTSGVLSNGSLVVANPRDMLDLKPFASKNIRVNNC